MYLDDTGACLACHANCNGCIDGANNTLCALCPTSSVTEDIAGITRTSYAT
jgi:hypothetical protein